MKNKTCMMQGKVLASGKGQEGTDRDALFAFSPSPDSLFPAPLLDVFFFSLPGPRCRSLLVPAMQRR